MITAKSRRAYTPTGQLFSVYRQQKAMNVLRSSLRPSLRRTYATTSRFVPPSQLDDVRASLSGASEDPAAEETEGEGQRRGGPQAPASPSFYSTRPQFYDQVAQLEKAISSANTALRRVQLLPHGIKEV